MNPVAAHKITAHSSSKRFTFSRGLFGSAPKGVRCFPQLFPQGLEIAIKPEGDFLAFSPFGDLVPRFSVFPVLGGWSLPPCLWQAHNWPHPCQISVALLFTRWICTAADSLITEARSFTFTSYTLLIATISPIHSFTLYTISSMAVGEYLALKYSVSVRSVGLTWGETYITLGRRVRCFFSFSLSAISCWNLNYFCLGTHVYSWSYLSGT